jgi:CHAT domain-containing protein
MGSAGRKVAIRLRRLKARRILLLPQGGLGLLPVHAAWREENGERRYLSDDVEITYAPSALALDTARRRAADHGDQTALVVGVSRSEQFGDIESVESEVKAVATLFRTEPLPDADATVATILGRSREVAYLHLACHGAFGWGSDPLASALYLAGDEKLSLADVIGRLDLAENQLVSLSACESGVVERSESPDEFFGLTAGFMQAGASGVLSSLWRVDDMSTRLIMERFYRNHLENALEPSAALREAQHWLRGLTREELGRSPEGRGLLLLGRREDRPYSSPYHWAAFTYNGV